MNAAATPTAATYLAYAKTWDGVREVPGTKSNPLITALWKAEAWLGDDDSKVPWCGLFMRKCMQECGLPYPLAAYRAKSWLSWGVPILTPVVGAVAIIARDGGAHVAIVEGVDSRGRVALYGGNQGDKVCRAYFDLSDPARVLGYRIPKGYRPPPGPLPVLATVGRLSTSEA